MKLFALSAAAAAFIAGPVLAGNLAPAPAEPVVLAPAPVVYAPAGVDWSGFYLGGQLGYGMGEIDDGEVTEDFDGMFGGVHAGYLSDFGNIVAGAELAYNLGSLEFDTTDGEIDQLAHAKLKLGYDLGRTLVYGTAGGAWANANIEGDDYNDFGWTVGAGIDYLVRDNITAGVEYTYNQFDNFDDTGNDITGNTIAAKVGFQF